MYTTRTLLFKAGSQKIGLDFGPLLLIICPRNFTVKQAATNGYSLAKPRTKPKLPKQSTETKTKYWEMLTR